MRNLLVALAAGSLGVCVYSAVQFFVGHWSEEGYKNVFLAASAAWFALAVGAQRLSAPR